jgi:murein DD-endopeptidase MepM/ murein hydrolase activator NlpD
VMDTTGNIVENNQIFNAAANVLIGEPKIGCWPVTGVLTTYPFMKSVPTHATTDAFDIGAPLGTPIYAPFPGSINDRGWDTTGYGNLITLEFVIPGDSTGQKRVVFFAHLSGVAAKFKGKNAEPVAAGEVIGYVGSTGNSTGPHLHYELKNNRNNPGDPGLGIRNIVPGGLTATVGTPTRSCK